MKVSQEYDTASMQTMFNNSKGITSSNNNKMGSEYKSPQQSKYKMASFTEKVMTRSSISKGKPKAVKSTVTTKHNFNKGKPKSSYLNSNIRKPQIKAVKHHEINLNKNEKGAYSVHKSSRKVLSTQKERVLQSSKLTDNVAKRSVSMLSNHKSRDRLAAKKTGYNYHSKSTLKRPFTSNSKRKSLATHNTGLEASRSYLNEGQKNSHSRNMINSTQSPDILRKKALLMQSNENKNDQASYDASYMSEHHNFTQKRVQEVDYEEIPSSSTPVAASHAYVRSTVTPVRFPAKPASKVFKIEPEAFLMQNTDEPQMLIVNLEDIVKEEDMIFNIQINITQCIKSQNLYKKWWASCKDSSVREMEMFFQEDIAKKLIRVQQIIVCITFGYVELNEIEVFKKSKTMSAVKNIMTNIHKNYLIFVQFVCRNLTDDQKTKTQEWVAQLFYILQNRPDNKSYYKSNNTQTLIRNNELSINLLKTLLRTSGDANEFMKLSLDIIKNIETIGLWWVRKTIREVVEYVKENKPKRSVSIMSNSALSRGISHGGRNKQAKFCRLGNDNLARKKLSKSIHDPLLDTEKRSSSKSILKEQGSVSSTTSKKSQDVKSLTINLYSDKKKNSQISNKPVKKTTKLQDYHQRACFSTKGAVDRISGANMNKPKSAAQRLEERVRKIKPQKPIENEIRCDSQLLTSEHDEDDDLLIFSERPNEHVPVPHKMSTIYDKRMSTDLLKTRPSRDDHNKTPTEIRTNEDEISEINKDSFNNEIRTEGINRDSQDTDLVKIEAESSEQSDEPIFEYTKPDRLSEDTKLELQEPKPVHESNDSKCSHQS